MERPGIEYDKGIVFESECPGGNKTFWKKSAILPMDMDEEEIVTRTETEMEMYRQPGTSLESYSKSNW